MSDITPTQDQLPALVARGLAIVETRLSGGVGSRLYESIRAQLRWIEDALAAPGEPDPARVDALLLGVYAAKELESSDPELAEVLFDVQYLVNRRWQPASAPAVTSRPVAAPGVLPSAELAAGGQSTADLGPLLAARMAGATRPQAIIAVVVLASGALMVWLAIAAHPWIVGLIFLLAFALAGFVSAAWLAWLLVTSRWRRRALLDLLEHHPEHIERIFAGVVVRFGFHAARMHAVPFPEADNLSRQRSGWYVVITRRGATPMRRWLGLHRESVPVARDEVLDLLAWLRAKAPSAEGPPPPP